MQVFLQNEVIFRASFEPCTFFMWVCVGRVKVTFVDGFSTFLEKDETIGQMNLIYDFVPNYDIEAASDCVVLVLRQRDFQRLSGYQRNITRIRNSARKKLEDLALLGTCGVLSNGEL
jgi:CRP-like cAMP-binding protein